ncbi:MAG: urea ABC transporter permease subunit UrtB [Burkholderiaceae bacterium]
MPTSSETPGLQRVVALLALTLALIWPAAASALTQAEALAMAAGTSSERIAAIDAALANGDDRLAAYLSALVEGRVRVLGERVLVLDQAGAAKDAVTGEAVDAINADEVINNNRMRRRIGDAMAALRLFAGDPGVRLQAAERLAGSAGEKQLGLIGRALDKERDAGVREALVAVKARIELAAADVGTRIAAARALGQTDSPAIRRLLASRLTDGGETDAGVRAEIERALSAIDGRLAIGESVGLVFAGISLGSVLLLAALGLAVTYGLMGVINMAHGELMMIGAYATWLTQQAFREWLPSAFDAYLLVAIPVAFLASALVGAVLERTVIRFLYGRALETLLATWGISLILMQAVRSLFGAQNVTVENPAWLSGGISLLPNLVLPWNRIAIIVFALIVLGGVGLLLARTRIGLFVRAATQNRTMARCVGVPTGRVDTLAFSLGAGIAGLAGCALSQIGNVGPDLGQGYIVDSFMVVVLGGVGQLAGAVYAGLGLGVLNKLLEGISGAVIAKIVLLVLIIVFIQKRPQGIFALKGRSAEA